MSLLSQTLTSNKVISTLMSSPSEKRTRETQFGGFETHSWDQRGLFRSRCLDKVPRQELEESRYRMGVVREELF